jgi:signal transduction histidine kinase/CheY-like chemotaxis protein/HAMP domain-containing protein/HPt (histidine-containing phosphotransfer) domain-containing protein
MRLRPLLIVAAVLGTTVVTTRLSLIAIDIGDSAALDKQRAAVETVSVDAAGLLALTQDFANHQTPRSVRQWSSTHDELVRALREYSAMGPQQTEETRELLDVASNLPALFAAVRKAVQKSASTQPDDGTQTLIDQLVSETSRISEGAVDVSHSVTVRRREAARAQRGEAVAAQLLLLTIAASLGWILASRVLKPIGRLRLVAEALERNDFTVRTEYRRSDELGQLAEAFDSMAESLSERELSLRLVRDQLEAGQAVLKEIIGDLPFGAVVYDECHRAVLQNERFFDLLSLPRDQLLGADFTLAKFVEICHSRGDYPNQTCSEALAHIRGLFSSREHVSIVRRQADGKHLDIRGTPLSRGWTLLTYDDITQATEASQAFALATEAAEQASRAKGEFLANMSHEIRTPLNAILGLSYMLEQRSLPQVERTMAAQIQTACRSLLGVVNDVLDISKIEAGHLELDEKPFSVRTLLESEIQMLGAGAAAKGLSLDLDVDPAVPALVMGDCTRLGQILTNLISNAIKFTAQGSVRVRIAPSPNLNAQGLQITVADTGVGIAPEALDRLFQPFAQADVSITRRFGGTGLGLSIVARLTSLMGGEVSLESVPGRGSTFSVVLPLRPAEEHDVRTNGEQSAALQILVADDDAIHNESVATLARALGWRVQTVSGGHALVERVMRAEKEGRPFDALIVDWKMPDLDGLSALAELRSQLGDGRVPAAIVVSAHDVAQLRADPHAGLAASVMVKPVDSSSLFNAVNNAVATSQAAQQRMRHSTGLGVGSGASIWLSDVRVLVVDDSELNLEVARHVLQHEGALVTCCNNGHEALALLKDSAQNYDVVLLDVQMPGMDGLEVAQRIRQHLGLTDLPLIALTAGVLHHERDRAAASGMNDFLGKPLEPRKLILALRDHVERYREKTIAVHARLQPPGDEAQPGFQIAGVDAEMVPATLRMDRSLFLSLLKRFLLEFGDVGNTSALLMTEPGRAILASRMHKLRGSAYVVGASGVGAYAEKLERELQAESSASDCQLTLAHLANELMTLSSGAEPHLRALDEQERIKDDAEEVLTEPVDRAGLDELRAMLRLQNMDAVDVFDRLAPGLRASLQRPAFVLLRASVHDLDFAEALVILRDL